jgi:Delta7-sterol 5-desaturase
VKGVIVFSAALLLAAPPMAMADSNVLGRWATPGVAAIVELAPCAGASTLCGTIRWLWDAVDDKGQSRLDAQNTDIGLRARPLLGLSILSGLTPAPGGGWTGRIYNPEDGQMYRATVRRNGADALLVEGCVLFICQKQVWRKASTLAEALH